MMMVRQSHKYISKRKKKAIRLRQALMPRNNDLQLRVAKLVKKGNTVEVDNIDMKIAVGQIK